MLQNFHKILVSARFLWSLYRIFHALTLKLPIQTSLSVAPQLQVLYVTGENMSNPSGKQAHPSKTPMRIATLETEKEQSFE